MWNGDNMYTVSHFKLVLVSVSDENRINDCTDKGYAPLSCTDKVLSLTLTPDSLSKQIKFNIDHGVKTDVTILNIAHMVNEAELSKDEDQKLLLHFLDVHEKTHGVRLSLAKVLDNIVTIELVDNVMVGGCEKDLVNVSSMDILGIWRDTSTIVLTHKDRWTHKDREKTYGIKILGILSK